MITFNEIPQAISTLKEDVQFIKDYIFNYLKETESKQWLNIDELCNYLPQRPVKSTIYGLVHAGKIPNRKQGKKLIFKKDEIDLWIESHKRKSEFELQREIEGNVDSFLVSKKKKDEYELGAESIVNNIYPPKNKG
jgi:excisionase family DNA binding protein